MSTFLYNIVKIKSCYTRCRCMSSQTRYSATLPANPFAFHQTRTIAEIMLRCDDRSSVKNEVHEGNLLQIKTISNEDSIFNYVYNRMNLISDSLKKIIINGDEADGRFVNLISIMNYDTLFKEFVEDVYYERLIDRNPVTDYDIMSFFEKKGRENQTVASWKYVTVYKLRRLYTRILFEAGLLKTSTGNRVVCTPYIGRSTIDELLNEGYETYIRATLGYR